MGLIHIYCGNGKGKTTAATGLAVRAAGAGKKVLFARFLKTEHSAELKSLALIPEIRVLPVEEEFGFIRSRDNPAAAKAREYYTAYWKRAAELAVQDDYDMLILDEINAAIFYGIVELEDVTEFLAAKPDKLEVVLTGRNPDPELLQLADYVSEICKKKHPYDRGIRAREGIEY